jgi:hypothetical protein
MSFNLVFLGAEQAGWREVLAEAGVTHVGTAYHSLLQRIPKKGGVDLSEWGFASVMLDSGGSAANKKPESKTVGEWRKYADGYIEFAHEHEHEVSLITEFDCLALGTQWIRDQREDAWADLAPGKFLPVWHPEHGLDDLQSLGERYGQVGITSEGVLPTNGVNPVVTLNNMARDGVRLHGLAMTKPGVLRAIQFTSASSLSWLSPTQYGDTLIWVNNDLKRYPMKYKRQARLRHASLFEDAGFDAERIQNDDATEVTRLSLWSWARLAEDIRERWGQPQPAGSNSAVVPGGDPDAPAGESAVVPTGSVVAQPVLVPRTESERKPMPMFAMTQRVTVDEDGVETRGSNLLEVRGVSPRRCDSCVMRKQCPEFKEASTCAYEIPVEVKSKEQKQALLDGVLAMQTQRVMFMRLNEEMQGGYADASLSQEVDRLLKIMNTQNDLENGSDFFSMTVKGRSSNGGLGTISSLFGPGPAARALPEHRVIEAVETDGIVKGLIEGRKVTE